jgi:hypothetical protein
VTEITNGELSVLILLPLQKPGAAFLFGNEWEKPDEF